MFTNVRSSAFRELAFSAAQTAAVECADNPEEFERIQRATMTAMRQTFPELEVVACEEVHQ